MPRGRKLDLEWLTEHYPTMTNIDTLLDDYEREFGWRPNKHGVYCKAHNLGLRKAPIGGHGERAERAIVWSKEPEMEAWMLEHDHGQRSDELKREWFERWGFNISRQQISLFRSSHGKQTRRSHGGGAPVPVGTERESKDGYIVIKFREKAVVPMSKDNWKLKHVWVWEQANGPLPEGHCVYFADGDKRNFEPDNLVAVPQSLVGQINLLKADGTEWHDADSLRAVMAMAEIRVARSEAIARMPRVCKCCGAHYTNWGRYQTGGCVTTTICPDCGKAGKKPPYGEHKGRQKYDRDLMRELAATGHTITEIAEIVGCSRTLASQVLNGTLDRRRKRDMSKEVTNVR